MTGLSEPRFRVVIAGGGVAGLETLTALRALAGNRVELTLVAPDDHFICRSLGADQPFEVGRVHSLSLASAARDTGATLIVATVDVVDPKRRTATTSSGDRLLYDALVLAVGAEPEPAVDFAATWDDRSGSELIGGLFRELREGRSRSFAVVIPAGPGWPLRGYELVLSITLQAKRLGINSGITLVVQEPSPLWMLGSGTVERISVQLARAGVTVFSGGRVEVEHGDPLKVVVYPSGRRVEADCVLALPTLHGRRTEGILTDVDGFLDADDHCRVRGLDNVWAAGDCTAFPVKSSGFAAEQADVVAENIAAAAGAGIRHRRFAPVLQPHSVGLPARRFLKVCLPQSDGDELSTHLPSGRWPMLTYSIES